GKVAQGRAHHAAPLPRDECRWISEVSIWSMTAGERTWLTRRLPIERLNQLSIFFHLDMQGAQSAGSFPWLSCVRNLRMNGYTARVRQVLDWLVGLSGVDRLVRLDLSYVTIGDQGLQMLLAAPWFGQVRELHLNACDLTAQGIARLIPALCPGQLRH